MWPGLCELPSCIQLMVSAVLTSRLVSQKGQETMLAWRFSSVATRWIPMTFPDACSGSFTSLDALEWHLVSDPGTYPEKFAHNDLDGTLKHRVICLHHLRC